MHSTFVFYAVSVATENIRLWNNQIITELDLKDESHTDFGTQYVIMTFEG